jgi:hypothetical protein
MPRSKEHVGKAGAPAPALDPEATVKQLQDAIRQARAQLISPTPENLDECRRRVDEAVNVLRQLQTGLPTGDFRRDSSLRAPLGKLRAEIARLNILLDGAAAFHTGWVRLAASMVAGYTADGTPGQPEPERRVWLEV